jgi:outer membrane protein TolC
VKKKISIIAGLVLVFAPRAGRAGPEQAAPLPSAADKLRSVVEVAWTAGPDLAEQLARLEAEAAFDRSTQGVGTPSVEFQTEGIGFSFDQQPNAIRYLRFGTPFHWPWQHTKSSKLGDEIDTWQSAEAQAARLEVAGTVARVWLQLAAVKEQIQVELSRVSRMNQAVRLQSERFELGEVAGMEVMQLELQQARDATTLSEHQAERLAMEAWVFALAGDDAPLPEPGDLQALAGPALNFDEPEWDQLEARAESGPLMASLMGRFEKQQNLSDLVGSTAKGRPSFFLEWEHVPELDGIPSFDAFGFLVSVPLPIGKQGGQRAAAFQAEAKAAASELERGKRYLVQRVRAAIAAARTSSERLRETESVRERLPRTERSLNEQFRLGAISYLVFIDGLARLDDLRLRRIRAYETLLSARLELAMVLGDPSLFPLPIGESADTQEAN